MVVLRELVEERPEKLFYVAIALVSASIVVVIGHAYIGTLVFGLFTYYATRPLYARVVERLGRPRVSAALTIIAFILPFVALLWYSGLIALSELRTFSETQNSLVIQEFVTNYIGVELQYTQFVDYVQNATTVRQVTGTFLQYISVVGLFLINALLVATFTYYGLIDGGKFRRRVDDVLPDDDALDAFVTGVDEDLQTLFFGNILHAALTGIIGSVTYAGLALVAPEGLGVPYPVLAGMGAGAASLIPVIGMKIVYVPLTASIGWASYQTGPETYWFPLAFFVVSLVIVDTIPDFIIRPYVSGDRLHLGALMGAYVVGPLFFGWYGLFLAPMLLVIVTNFYTCILGGEYEPTPESSVGVGDRVVVTSHERIRVGVVEEIADDGPVVRYEAHRHADVEWERELETVSTEFVARTSE